MERNEEAAMRDPAPPSRNDNAPSDGNANDVPASGAPSRPLVRGTDSPCDDPELAEFEMLECQELEAYVAEDFVGLRERAGDAEDPPPTARNSGPSQPDLNSNAAGDGPSATRERNRINERKSRAARDGVPNGVPNGAPNGVPNGVPVSRGGSPGKAKSIQVKKRGSFDQSPRKKNNSVERSLKQLSSEYTAKKQLSFDASRASSVERRKPWVNSGRPPVSPAKVPGLRAAVGKPGPACSGIPKPVAPLQKEGDVGRCSPPPPLPKNKNIHPKIITSVRKNPQRGDVHPPGHDEGSRERPSRGSRPQLGLGAVTRQPAAGVRLEAAPARKSSPGAPGVPGQASGPPGPGSSPGKPPAKWGQSGLRPPGFSAKSAAFVRSLSSMSGESYACRGPQSLRRESAKESQTASALKSSPLKSAVVSPKPQSPAAAAAVAVAGRSQEADRALIKLLRERCEQQARRLRGLQAQLARAWLCSDVFSVATQHFCRQSESAAAREEELASELARIRDEVAFSVSHWEQLQREKEAAERRFRAELGALRAQQRLQLGALEERLRARHAAEARDLRALQRERLHDLRVQQRQQMDEMKEKQEASLGQMEATHHDTLATLREEHARTVKNLTMAHQQQRKSLEEEFEKIRLSLQDQVDTLTFQNRSLRDRAERFEQALRKSTDEQIVDALAPYKHIEEDLKSLKEVLEMKNQQIHLQDLKITELEQIAQKNVQLEERVQLLQQQNEDLNERIHKNLAVSRQLSEENANLHVHVEKESTEKKRLSRTNEELLWRLQTGELSPRMSPGGSPSGSPVHQASDSPARRPHSCHQ
ncbi:microtubule-associated tumor suppressor candidate 2 homolog isoform X2 [Stigmatopora nigra]